MPRWVAVSMVALAAAQLACPGEVCESTAPFTERALLDDPSPLARASGGFVALDFDDDGDLDLAVPRGFTFHDRIRRSDAPLPPVLLRNDGETFTDVSAAAGFTEPGYFATVVAGDFNNDGLDDLFFPGTDPRDGEATDSSPDWVYLNAGDGSFTRAPLDEPAGVTLAACAADFDGDGNLDLFLANEQDRDNPACDPAGGCGAFGQTDELYRGGGDGRFERVTSTAGALAALPGGWSDGCLAWDYDGDLDTDLFIARKYGGITVLRNDGGFDFVDATAEVLDDKATALGQWMGFAVLDVDGDQDEELFATNWGASHYSESPSSLPGEGEPFYVLNALYDHGDDDTFAEIAAALEARCLPPPPPSWSELPEEAAGLAATDFGWGVHAGDYDLDGRTDLFFVGSLAFSAGGQVIGSRDLGANPGTLLRNVEGGFESVGVVEGVQNVDDEGFIGAGLGAALLDLDGDGRLQAIIGRQWFGDLNHPGLLRRWIPTPTEENRWLGLVLRGTASNPNGVGARVVIETDAGLWTRSAVSASAFSTTPAGRLHFGLGPSARVERVQITWPSGTLQVLEEVALDQWLTVAEAGE